MNGLKYKVVLLMNGRMEYEVEAMDAEQACAAAEGMAWMDNLRLSDMSWASVESFSAESEDGICYEVTGRVPEY